MDEHNDKVQSDLKNDINPIPEGLHKKKADIYYKLHKGVHHRYGIKDEIPEINNQVKQDSEEIKEKKAIERKERKSRKSSKSKSKKKSEKDDIDPKEKASS